MATKTPPRSAPRPRKAASAPAAPPPRSKQKPSRPSRIAPLLESHRDDLIGIGLVVAALLVALGVYTHAIGLLGDGIAWLGGMLVGIGRFALPVLLVLVAVAMFSDRKSEHPLRLAVGLTMFALAVLGLIHVGRGPVYGMPAKELRSAGGVVGAALGRPLQALMADLGARVVLVAFGLVGLLVATRSTVRTVAVSAARGSAPSIRAMRGAARNLSTLTSERLGNAADRLSAPGPVLFDGSIDDEADDDEQPAKAPRARRALPPPDPFINPQTPVEQPTLDLGPAAKPGVWKLPPANLMLRTEAEQVDMPAVIARGEALVSALSSHGVGTKLVGQTVGPTVTRYELELEEGVKVARVTSLNRDIAYAMAATDVRILAPIPGRKAIGIEVPNVKRHLVALGDLLSSKEAKQAVHPLEVGIGKDIAGRSVFLNLATTPHLLIAGTTGAGKSSGINCVITSLLMRTTPDQVKLILIDPKQFEMGQYARLPHLLTQPVTNPKKAANALAWAVREMERRYDLLSEVGFRDITGYNAAYDRGELTEETETATPIADADKQFERLPFIVVVVDELNDLMMVAARDVEESVTRIAQKARAVGIHLIIATQRPSVNVITGVIKANVPARMAFAVSSLTDSRVILDQAGAEKLIGKGDMLLLPGSSSVAQRIQGAFVSEEEVRKVAAHWKRQAPEPTYVTGVEGDETPGGSAGGSNYTANGDDDDDETLVRAAMELIVRSQLGSTSMLQRKLKVGFARAGRIMDLLEQRGVVGPSEGSKARSVLMTVEEYEAM
jgi:DNA segregation ATPase FtsK/SpoIIIE, S-DNA-T family